MPWPRLRRCCCQLLLEELCLIAPLDQTHAGARPVTAQLGLSAMPVTFCARTARSVTVLCDTRARVLGITTHRRTERKPFVIVVSVWLGVEMCAVGAGRKCCSGECLVCAPS